MSFDKFLASVRHASSPHSPDFHLRLTPKKVQGYMEVDGPREVEKVVDDDGEADDESLADFGAINARKNINAVGGERRQ